MTGWFFGMMWAALKAFLFNLGWPQLALLAGGALFAVLLVGTLIGKFKDHTGKMMVASAVLMLAAWYGWPRAKPPVVVRRPIEVKLPKVGLPRIELPEVVEVPVPVVMRPDPDPEELRRAAAELRAAQEEQRRMEEERRLAEERLAEEERKRLAREQAAMKKMALRARNEWARAVTNDYLARGIDQAVTQYRMQQQAIWEGWGSALAPRPPVMLPPGARRVR